MTFISVAKNRKEMFPCSKKKIKEIFKNTLIDIRFEHEIFLDDNNDTCYKYIKNSVKGTVIADVLLGIRQPNPLLSIYALKKGEFSDALVNQVENIYLNKILDIYMKLLHDIDSTDTYIKTYIILEFLDNKLKMHVAELNFLKK